MSPQADFIVSNGTGAAVRSDINGQLAAIVSNNSGATEPGTMYAYQWWADTTTGLLKQRNAANSAWTTIGTLASANLGLLSLAGGTMTGALAVTAGTAALPGIAVSGDLNTGITSPGADQLAISTGGTSRLAVSTTAVSSTLAVDVPLGAVGTPSLTFTGDLNTGVFSPGADTLALVTGGTNRVHVTSGGLVGINTTSPASLLHVAAALPEVQIIGSTNAYLTIRGASGGPWTWRSNSTSLSVEDNGSERLRIDSSGRLLVGTSTSRTIGLPTAYPSLFQIETTNYAALSLVNNSGDVQPAYLTLGKSRGGIGSNTIVQSGDVIGHIGFAGADGTDIETLAAHIQCAVDGTPGANDMPGRLTFSTTADGASSPTERMRITNGGLIAMGTTDPTVTPSQGFCFDTRSDGLLRIGHANGTSSGSVYVLFGYNSVAIGSIYQSGTTGVTYSTSSDYRLKENVVAIADSITRLQQLKPSRFNFIAEPGRTVDGFLAHEVQAVVPEAINGTKDEVGADGNPVFQGIDQSKLVPLLTAALQEAIAEINALKDRLTAAGIA